MPSLRWQCHYSGITPLLRWQLALRWHYRVSCGVTVRYSLPRVVTDVITLNNVRNVITLRYALKCSYNVIFQILARAWLPDTCTFHIEPVYQIGTARAWFLGSCTFISNRCTKSVQRALGSRNCTAEFPTGAEGVIYRVMYQKTLMRNTK